MELLINSATVFRALLIGGFLLLLPRVTRRGLLFGTYVGEATWSGPAARDLVRSWYGFAVAVIFAGLATGMAFSLAGRTLLGNRVSLAVLLVGAAALYLRFHFAARRLVPDEADHAATNAAAPLLADERGGQALPLVTIALCLVIGIATFTFAALSYPELKPTKSLVAVMVMPFGTLFLGPYVGFFSLLATRAKRCVRLGGGRSVDAQMSFRTAFVRITCAMALLMSVVLAWTSVQLIRVWLGRADSMGQAFGWFCGFALAFAVGCLVTLAVRYGQGGALVEDGEAPLTNGLADNRRWMLGIFYVDRDDPSIMVEERFGLGYTVNFGNPAGVVTVGGFFVMITAFLTCVYMAS